MGLGFKKIIQHKVPDNSEISEAPTYYAKQLGCSKRETQLAIELLQRKSKNVTDNAYDKYILCANSNEMHKRWSTDVSVLTSYYGAVTARQRDHLIYTDTEIRHYVYPDVVDGIQKVNELEIDASAIQLLSMEELMSLINTFKMRICITRHPKSFSNKRGD